VAWRGVGYGVAWQRHAYSVALSVERGLLKTSKL